MQYLEIALCLGLLGVSLSHAEQVHRWGMQEIALEGGQDHGVHAQDVALEVVFTHAEAGQVARAGFWDGGRTWRARFSPGSVGAWRWRTRCRDDAALDGREGSFTCVPYGGSNPLYRHGPLRVSDNGRYFVHADGTPFLWLVDTAWNGALKSRPDDWRRYLDDRVRKQFTGVQYVVTQWRAADANAEGDVAYTGYEDIQINPAFFGRIDTCTQAVNESGLLAVPVLLWTLGSKLHNPGQLPEDQAVRLARYMTARLGAWHVAWFLPGDGNYSGSNAERWKRIGRAVFGQPDHAPVTLHPQGMQWPWEAFSGEAWISFLGYQSGHGDDENTLKWIYAGPPAQKWKQANPRPVINLEPPYEDHLAYQSRKPHTAYSVRRAVYWSLLNAPTAGSSYGAHGVWGWDDTAKTPQDHGGSGVAQPWHKAMSLPGSTHMKHVAELFTSVRWWELAPSPELVSSAVGRSSTPDLTYIAYTRTTDGRAALYIDGVQVSDGRVPGSLENWDEDYAFMLANELTGDRPWLGELRRVAVYDRAFDEATIRRRHADGAGPGPQGALVLYTFREGHGAAVRDVSKNGTPLDLRVRIPDAVEWVPGGGLRVTKPVVLSSDVPASKIVESISRTQCLTIEAWCRPANLTQAGPARILSLSRDTGQRNFTLGQVGSDFEMRLRTTRTSDNGIPALSSGSGRGDSGHIAASRSASGDLAVIYLATGGTVALNLGVLARGLRAEWFDPRSGARHTAQPVTTGSYRTPDGQDWVLLLQ